MVVFGGQTNGGNRLNDIWAFDLTTNSWTDITPDSGSAPVIRITPASVYDSDNHQMLMFSGQSSGSTFLNDTWKFDLTTNTWTEFMPPGPIPAIRYGVATCYDPIDKRQVNFAGFTFMGRFDDTWGFDPVADTYTNISPVAGSPLERCLHVASYDSQKHRMIIYGGQNGGPLGDIWAFDLAAETWTDLTPSTSPDPRWFSTLEYDPANNRVTMFSGNRSGLGKANDVWVFDLWTNEWTELLPTGTLPTIRDGAASIYIASEDRMVIFGGREVGYLGDVWSLNNLSNTATGINSSTPPVADGTVLHQNYPNPFNPTTEIIYELSAAGEVLLSVYDPAGRLVRTLINGFESSGRQRVFWDGRNDAGGLVSSGVYVYQLTAGRDVLTRKMLLLK